MQKITFMTRFIRLFFLSIGLIVSLAASGQVESGAKSLGIRGGYVSCTDAGTAGLAFQYTFTRHFRLSGEANYFFRHNGCDGASFSIDYHCPFLLGKRFYIYPIAGLNFASWHHRPDDGRHPDIKDTSTRTTRIGLNTGAGLEYYVRSSLKLSLEGKYNWIKDDNTAIVNLGISYVF